MSGNRVAGRSAMKHWGAWTSLLYLLPAGSALALDPPVVYFDLPSRLVAHEVVDAEVPSHFRLIEVSVPISARVVKGDVAGVQEISIEVDAGRGRLLVHDFAPQTTLGTELAGDIQVTTTNEKAYSFEASLGGQSPVPLGDVIAQVTPSISAGKKDRHAETQSTSRLSPKKPLVVSGTINEGHGTFFQLRPSSQTTLEGQHSLSLVLRVPDDWVLGELEVRCCARGERQFLWFDQPQVWGSMQRKVRVSLAGLGEPSLSARPYMVAKQPTEAVGENWVAAEKACAAE